MHIPPMVELIIQFKGKFFFIDTNIFWNTNLISKYTHTHTSRYEKELKIKVFYNNCLVLFLTTITCKFNMINKAIIYTMVNTRVTVLKSCQTTKDGQLL